MRIKLQCKDYSAAAAGRPQLQRPEGLPVWTPAPLSSLKVGRGRPLPTRVWGCWVYGCPARLGSATSQTSGIRSIRTTRGREQKAAPLHGGVGGTRPPTGSLGPQNAPPLRVSDSGLCHPRVPGGSGQEGVPSPRAAPLTPENAGSQAAPQQRVHGSWPSPKQEYISQSSGCATLLQDSRALAFKTYRRIPGSWPKLPTGLPGPDLNHPRESLQILACTSLQGSWVLAGAMVPSQKVPGFWLVPP